MFEKSKKVDNFQVGDWVLKWDIVREDKGKNGKFDSLWIGTFCDSSYIAEQHLQVAKYERRGGV